MQAVRNNVQVVAKYNVHHRARNQLPRFNSVSFNGCYSESLPVDYTGVLWYLLRKAYKPQLRLKIVPPV